METFVTCSGDSPSYSGRMPSSDAADSSVSSVSLFGEMLDSVSFDDSLSAVAFGDSHDIDEVIDVHN